MKSLVTSLNTEAPIDARLEEIVEEAANRLQDGEPIDLDELAAAHPEYAEQLRELLPAVAMLVRLGDGPPPSPNPSPPRGGEMQQLGDFRIVRELGRGGMGTVFEAEQMSMGRRVALKVLPFAALAQDKALQRFRNEVRAAAALDHPHIVSVYSVGEERGIHFYAMQLIRGRTMADLIVELRQASRVGRVGETHQAITGDNPLVGLVNSTHPTAPSPRPLPVGFQASPTTRVEQARVSTVGDTRQAAERFRSAARLGIQAAEALQHAHDLGVLHRDIKPSNLMLDHEGQLSITDFGLARIEADAGMTMTGDILGTLRYMAPEQALAKHVVIDHRADIYSLGATLYELLTLQPAFGETDRSELLKQIAFAEPRPLRKIDRRIPVELETIVLKAMAKSRDERYQTAQRLADDLRAFMEDRPIKARPPTLVNRAAKWSRRHHAVVAIAGLALAVLTAVLAVSMAFVERSQTQVVAALEEKSDLLYAADMTVAYQVFEKGWSDEVQTILDRQRPAAGEPDRRGLEWHLLNKLVRQPDSVTLAGHSGPVSEIAVFPDGRRLASVGKDGTLRIWDIRGRQLLRTIAVCKKELNSVAISPDGRFVAVGSDAVYLCDVAADYGISWIFQDTFGLESLVFSPDGQHLAAGSRYDHVVLITRDGQVVKRIPCASRVESLEYVSGTSLLLVLCHS